VARWGELLLEASGDRVFAVHGESRALRKPALSAGNT
jgi:hypothetical protein